MRRSVAALLFLAFATLSGLYAADGPAASVAKSLADETEHLVKQLADVRFPVRADALSELEKRGPAVLPLLQDALRKATDPEIKRRLEELVPRMEMSAALAPTRVSLSLKDVPIRKAIQELATQTKYRIELYPNAAVANDNRERVISLELKNATFWEALQQLNETAGLTLQEGHYSQEPLLRLEARENSPGYCHLDGPFRMTVRSFQYYRTLDLTNRNQAAAQPNELLYLSMTLSVEPRLPLMGVGHPNITEALDDLDQSLKPVQQARGSMVHSYGGYRPVTQQIQTQLKPTPNGRRLKVLKGTLPVTVIAIQKPKITVEKLGDIKQPQTFKSGTVTLSISDVGKDANGHTSLKLNLTDTAIKGHDYTWANTVTSRIEVTDEKGTKLHAYGSNWSINANGVQGNFTYGGTPAKLVYNEWTTVSHEIPFSFSDLPLP